MRNIKKFIASVVLLCMTITMLTGCMAEDISIKINENGEGLIGVGVYFSEDLIRFMGSESNQTPEEVIVEMIKSDDKGDINDIAYKTVNGSKYIGLKDAVSFRSIKELRDYLYSENENSGYGIVVDETYHDGKKYLTIGCSLPSNEDILTEAGIPELSKMTADDLKVLYPDNYKEIVNIMNQPFAVSLNVEFPGDVIRVDGITSNNYSIDGNKVSVNIITSDRNKEVYVTGLICDDDTDSDGFGAFKPVKYYKGQFKDIASNSWFSDSVKNVYRYGITSGTSDTTYSPNEKVTLAQLIVMTAKMNAIYNGDIDEQFNKTDSSEAWYQPYLRYLVEQGLMSYTDFSDFSKPATRGEACYIISKAGELGEGTKDIWFNDVNYSNKYAKSIYEMASNGIVSGVGNGSFKPNDPVTRAQAAKIIDKMIDSQR